MTVLSVEEAQPKLKELMAQVEQGEQVVFTTPTGARLQVSLEQNDSLGLGRPDRVLGLLKGKLEVPDSFFDPLPEEELWG